MKGFIALTAVLIILAISLMLGLTISRLSINEMIMGLNQTFSSKAYYLANLCLEEGLMRFKESGYQGEEVIELTEEGNCELIVRGDQVMALGNYQNQVKKIKVVIGERSPKITIRSWEEVGEFEI